ncbi:MAG: hypothetical protein ABFC57_12710 [Veillonellales bacterium]
MVSALTEKYRKLMEQRVNEYILARKEAEQQPYSKVSTETLIAVEKEYESDGAHGNIAALAHAHVISTILWSRGERAKDVVA